MPWWKSREITHDPLMEKLSLFLFVIRYNTQESPTLQMQEGH